MSFAIQIRNILEQSDFPTIPQLSALDLKTERIIIYGAGSGFITLSMFVLERFKILPEVVLDKKFLHQEVKKGVLYSSPTEYRPSDEMLKNALVIITIGNMAVREDIKKDLLSQGFRNIVSAMEIYEYHLPQPTKDLTTKGFTFYKEQCSNLIEAFELFDEPKSQEVFKQFIFTHIYRKILLIPAEPLENQYFPFDLWDKSVYTRSVICGAYNGDTTLALVQKAGNVKAMVCLEPDPENFTALKNNTNHLKKQISDFMLLPFGVYKENKQMLFSAYNQSNSAISSTGNILIQCVALDDCLPNFAPSFISMDIEGSEFYALQGMAETIKKHRPKLAICVYHSPEHIWTIPLFLRSLVKEYKFYLRNYTSFSSETVLYAE